MMNSKQIALIAMMSALTVVVAYSRGLTLSSLPGVFEFMTVLIFISGFCFGWVVGASVGAISLIIYILIPYPFAHPAAWMYSISPVLLVVMAGLGLLFGVAGAAASRVLDPVKVKRFAVAMAALGFSLTFAYDILSSIGFALAYPAFESVWDAIVLTFVPLYMPWPPIVHTVTNTVIFAILVPPLIGAIRLFPETLNTGQPQSS